MSTVGVGAQPWGKSMGLSPLCLHHLHCHLQARTGTGREREGDLFLQGHTQAVFLPLGDHWGSGGLWQRWECLGL